MPLSNPRWIILLMGILVSCNQTPPEVLVPDNQAPNYDGISTLQIRNYVNRLYIDLLGREPLDAEMDRDVQALRDADLAEEARLALIVTLQTGSGSGGADTSYIQVFYNRWYELTKARMLEGVSDGEIKTRKEILTLDAEKDSLEGNWVSYMATMEEVSKLERILECEEKWMAGEIDLTEMYGRMLNNYFYDLINMNTFNFIQQATITYFGDYRHRLNLKRLSL